MPANNFDLEKRLRDAADELRTSRPVERGGCDR